MVIYLFVNTGLSDIFSISPGCLWNKNNQDLKLEWNSLRDNRGLQQRRSNEQSRVKGRTYSYTLFPLPALYLS